MIKTILLFVLGLIVVVAAGIFLYLQHPIWGAKPTGERLTRIESSPNYKNGEFQNLHPVEVMVQSDEDSPSMVTFS